MATTREDALQRLLQLGLSEPSVTTLTGLAKSLRSQYRSACASSSRNVIQWLLQLDDEKDLQSFTIATGEFSKGAASWLTTLASKIALQQSTSDAALPPFTLYSYGSFGRQEMSPFSDLDVVVLCDETNINVIQERFADNLARAAAALIAFDDANFHVSFETPSKAYSPEAFVSQISLNPAHKTVEIFPVYEHPTEGSTQSYTKAFHTLRPSIQAKCPSFSATRGLNSLTNSDAYETYKTRTTEYDIKRILAFFQKSMAIYNAYKLPSKPLESDLPNATLSRLLLYAGSGNEALSWRKTYLQIFALRCYLHFKEGKEVDGLVMADGGERVACLVRIKPALDSVLRSLDGLLKSMN